MLCNTFVTTDQGTGIVHQAPYFGEVDYQNCLENGLITKDMKIVCPVDESGRFTEEVTDFKGMYVKDADKQICKRLKESGNLIKQGEVKHSYPFCWRSDTPLLYKAVPSWFIRVEQIVPSFLPTTMRRTGFRRLSRKSDLRTGYVTHGIGQYPATASGELRSTCGSAMIWRRSYAPQA